MPNFYVFCVSFSSIHICSENKFFREFIKGYNVKSHKISVDIGECYLAVSNVNIRGKSQV